VVKDLFPDEMTESEVAAAKWKSLPIDPREAAREWIADTLRSHLHPTLHPVGGEDRIKEVAALVEAESYREGWPIETAVELAIEWAEAKPGSGSLGCRPQLGRTRSMFSIVFAGGRYRANRLRPSALGASGK
jgi:hypothetical protein